MRKFKVLCDFGYGSFGNDEGSSWETIESETNDYDEIATKAKSLFTCDVDIEDIKEIFDTPLNDKHIFFDSADGFTYAVPVMKIAEKRASYYSHEFGNDEGLSMIEDTLPLFEADSFEIEDYAKNNMHWSDVERFALKLERKDKPKPDYQDEWVNNKFTIK